MASAFAEVHEQAAACWAVHAPVGSAVTPSMCTRRVLISITKNTYWRLWNTMSACRKSHDKIPDAGERSGTAAGPVTPGVRGAEPGCGQDPADRSRAHLTVGRPAFSGQLNWCYFMLRAAGSGTR